jgi:hypothetical protein
MHPQFLAVAFLASKPNGHCAPIPSLLFESGPPSNHFSQNDKSQKICLFGVSLRSSETWPLFRARGLFALEILLPSPHLPIASRFGPEGFSICTCTAVHLQAKSRLHFDQRRGMFRNKSRDSCFTSRDDVVSISTRKACGMARSRLILGHV